MYVGGGGARYGSRVEQSEEREAGIWIGGGFGVFLTVTPPLLPIKGVIGTKVITALLRGPSGTEEPSGAPTVGLPRSEWAGEASLCVGR